MRPSQQPKSWKKPRKLYLMLRNESTRFLNHEQVSELRESVSKLKTMSPLCSLGMVVFCFAKAVHADICSLLKRKWRAINTRKPRK